MKITDYSPRAAPFDSYLKYTGMVGAEIGADVGSHAHAILRYCCNVQFLYLIDIWDKEFYKGYCQGRLHSAGYKDRVEMIQSNSRQAISRFKSDSLDFIYIDITHDYESVSRSLYDWWPVLKQHGVMGYRNYATINSGLVKAVDEFVKEYQLTTALEAGEIIIFKE
jgi:predicted O-methyltransferase YrrM